MIIRFKTDFIILLFVIAAALMQAAIKPEIQAIITCYEKGEPDKCKTLLQTAQADNNDEKAIVNYYNAILTDDVEAVKMQLQQLIETYPKTKYAQKAMFEIGHIHLLERDYDKAIAIFNKVTDPELAEKHYWLANSFYQKGDFSNAIASGNQYIRLGKSRLKTEEIYYLITDAYININQFNNAINTLKKLLSLNLTLDDEQYLRYRYGYATEMLDDRPEAISQYKQGYELDRYSQLAYLIEDRLFEMHSRFGSNIDLSFLYPYVESPLPDIVLAEQMNPEYTNGTEPKDSTKVVSNNVPSEIREVPKQGIYLQTGRFSQQNNALKLAEKICSYSLNAQYFKSTQSKDVSWVVIVGPFITQLEAINAKQVLRENGIDSFIIQK